MKDGNYVALVVEDDPKLLESVCVFLEGNQYLVFRTEDGETALSTFYAHNHEIDIVLLDVMLPTIDGYQVLKEIRALSDVPIIMMTAREGEEDQLEGLLNGADNYLVKPFRLRVLLAHMENIIHRTHDMSTDLIFGDLRIDERSQEVRVDGRPVSMTAKEYMLLIFFIKNSNTILSRDTILDHVWGYDYTGDIRTVDTVVKQLRRKLTSKCPYIFSVYGLGYCFKET